MFSFNVDYRGENAIEFVEAIVNTCYCRYEAAPTRIYLSTYWEPILQYALELMWEGKELEIRYQDHQDRHKVICKMDERCHNFYELAMTLRTHHLKIGKYVLREENNQYIVTMSTGEEIISPLLDTAIMLILNEIGEYIPKEEK